MQKNDIRSPLKIIAHRCRGFGHPENTFRAFRSALHSSVDGVEIDLRLTKDRKWVVTHNPGFRSEESQDLRLHQKTFRQIRNEVTALDALLATFSAFGEGKLLFLDVKDVGEEKSLLRLLHRHGVADQAIIIGWEYAILQRIHSLDPTIRIGFSYVPLHRSMKKFRASSRTPITRLNILVSVNAPENFDESTAVGHTHQHYLSELPSLPLYSIQVPGVVCSPRLVRDAHARKILVIPFFSGNAGVNNRIVASALKRIGVDGILTDEPMRFLSSSSKG